MVDKLREWFDEKVADDNLTPMQIFQAGVTAGAVSMRDRAMSKVAIPGSGWTQDNIVNYIKNGIGQLSDIPTE
jgi:hypothetical protein